MNKYFQGLQERFDVALKFIMPVLGMALLWLLIVSALILSPVAVVVWFFTGLDGWRLFEFAVDKLDILIEWDN